MTTQLDFNSALAPQLPLKRFTVAEYHRFGEIGVLTPDDKVELLEGWIVKKMNQRPIHGYIVGLLSEWFQNRLPPGHIVRCQLPITTQRSEPEPDLAIIAGTHQDFRECHPSGKDCRLIIEVADTSLERDRAKAAIYHSAGVEEYWIVNVDAECIERFQLSSAKETPNPSIITAGMQASIRIGQTEMAVDVKQIFA